MIMREDISPGWKPEDVALFAGLMTEIQKVVVSTVRAHRREGDPVLHVAAAAIIAALRGLYIESGIQSKDVARAMGDFHRTLLRELDDFEAKTKAAVATFEYAGRA